MKRIFELELTIEQKEEVKQQMYRVPVSVAKEFKRVVKANKIPMVKVITMMMMEFIREYKDQTGPGRKAG